MALPALIPLATITATLSGTHVLPNGPTGTRVIAEVGSFEVEGDRLRGSMASPAAADWLTLSPDGTYGTLDVRVTIKTHDDALVHIEYSGRIDMGSGSIVSAPLFQTGAEQYAWLNRIQAIGIGQNSPEHLIYELYEVRPS